MHPSTMMLLDTENAALIDGISSYHPCSFQNDKFTPLWCRASMLASKDFWLINSMMTVVHSLCLNTYSAMIGRSCCRHSLREGLSAHSLGHRPGGTGKH